MNKEHLLQPELQQFIRQHEVDDENKLLLKHKFVLGVASALVANQVVGRRKAKLKLPSWYATPNILYPPSLNIEQSSSEITAAYKAEILKQFINEPNKVADLTGGFGVDSFFLSSIFKEVDYIEPDENLFEFVKHNHTLLQKSSIKNPVSRIQHIKTTAEKFLDAATDTFNLLYIDPSRRTKGNQKIFRFADCQPDVIQLLPRIFQLSDCLFIKASPLIDLQSGIRELQCVERIFVVAVDNECKEVLFLCRKNFKGEVAVSAINLKSAFTIGYSKKSFDFFPSEEKNSITNYSNPLTYLYEPNVAILKAGAFKLIGNQFHLHKLQQNTHLYTSDVLALDFPGRIFKVETIIKPEPKFASRLFPEGKANVVTRNYPLSPEQLKKKTGLKDGGEKFLIGFSGQTEKFTAVCNRIT